MPIKFPVVPSGFAGREAVITRFKARLEHFSVFIYGGMAGIGKTAMMLRLAKETRAIGVRGAVYLPLWPSESVGSILARVEAACEGSNRSVSDRPGDPYGRLSDYLDDKKITLLLDDLHHLRRDDLVVLTRSVRLKPGRYRIIATSEGDLELPAVDQLGVHSERLGPLTADEVKKVANSLGVRGGEAQGILMADVQRGGLTGHPLTLRFLLTLFGSDLPSEEFFRSHTSRSAAAFRSVIEEAGDRFDAKEREILRAFGRIGLPVAKGIAARVFGTSVPKMIKRGLLELIDDEVQVHSLVTQTLGGGIDLSATQAKAIAKHLKDQGMSRNEPQRVLRAAELLARAGPVSKAIDTLTDGWEAARDFGFLEAYLKSVANIPTTPALEQRLKLLSARARMRQGNPQGVRPELEQLAKSKDSWTRLRAQTALTYVYAQLHQHKLVVQAYDQVRGGSVGDHLLLPAGALAAVSMVRIGRVADAEKLAKTLLKRIKGKKHYDREGELRRLLARIYAQSGQLQEAVDEAQHAAKSFELGGDLYHAATAHGFIGDLYRETGDFELAQKAFQRFYELAERWGDRNLLQVAELADAWVSLDVGDLSRASKRIAAVEKEMSVAPSRRLKRYLAAAKALLEAGRGHHEDAANQLERVVEVWDAAGQRAIADVLRAQLVRSLIASNNLGKARSIVDAALERLDANTAAPRVAAFLRESALIRLRRKDVKRAMAELRQARKLFAKGGNRREEALTIYRIAHAALDEGDTELATARAKEALTLARKIKHTRVIALSRELQGRLALLDDKPKAAVTAMREALQALRRLGDELGTLHASESLLRSMVVAGDLTSAIRMGPKVSEQAERLQIREVKIRAIVLTGVALLRRGRVDQAKRCFKELTEAQFSPLTEALMWRLGEGLSSVAGNVKPMLERRAKWAEALRRLPGFQQGPARHVLEQLDLPPQERAILRVSGKDQQLNTEAIGWLQVEDYDVYIDIKTRRVVDKGTEIFLESGDTARLFNKLVLASPATLSNEDIFRVVYNEEPGKRFEGKVNKALKALLKALKETPRVKIQQLKSGAKMTLPKNSCVLIPSLLEMTELKPLHRKMLRLLRRYGTLPLQAVQAECKLTRSAARRELGELAKDKLVIAVRDGRGQAFRLA